MSFVRTVLGDIDPAELGVTYAHEHLVIAGSRTVELFPDFRLDDVDKAVQELASAQALGLRSVIDAMPADAGRDVVLLAEVSRRSGIQLVAPTGVHHQRYYPERHWSALLSVEEVGVFKPHQKVYQLAVDRLALPPDQIAFQSSNAWDVAGAKAFGYQVAWCNRTGAPDEELGVGADLVIDALDQLPR